MPRRNRNLLKSKWSESLKSVLPIAGIVVLLSLTVVPVPNNAMMGFMIGALLLMAGMALFTLGTDLAMTPIGEYVGGAISKSKKIWGIALIGFVVGMLVTLAEPDLQVLAEQVPGVPNLALMLSVGAGVGLFMVIALMRIIFHFPLKYLLLGFYALVFGLAFFVPRDFLAVAFDSGGVTTGPMTVPFILSLGVGVSALRSDSNAENDSFGLVALCSIGPILAVMVLGLLYRPDSGAYVSNAVTAAELSTELSAQFVDELPHYLGEVARALAPILGIFMVMQATQLHIRGRQLMRIIAGIAYTYVGLVLFLLGVNVGFMPVGSFIGQSLAAKSYNWVLIPLGMIFGYLVVAAEPAVHVLNRQVYEITAGAIPQRGMSLSLSIGVAVSVGLAMLRILCGIPILNLLIPGYAIALILMFLAPPIFTSIAFDSGGVASGPMTATFLLPFAIGACTAMGGDVVADAFGVVAMVAMTPLITIQLLGVYVRFMKPAATPAPAVEEIPEEEDIIELE